MPGDVAVVRGVHTAWVVRIRAVRTLRDGPLGALTGRFRGRYTPREFASDVAPDRWGSFHVCPRLTDAGEL